MTKRVLLVDDDREVREALGQTLELADLEPILAGSYLAAKDHIAPGFDGVIGRAYRPPADFLRDAQQLLGPGGVAVMVEVMRLLGCDQAA